MIDYTKLHLSSSASSNKVLLEGTGTYSVPNLPGAGQTKGSATIAHNFGSDNLLFQVQATSDLAGTTNWTMLPWESNDSRVIQYASIDSLNLYVTTIHSDSSGSGFPAATVNFYYRVLIP